MTDWIVSLKQRLVAAPAKDVVGSDDLGAELWSGLQRFGICGETLSLVQPRVAQVGDSLRIDATLVSFPEQAGTAQTIVLCLFEQEATRHCVVILRPVNPEEGDLTGSYLAAAGYAPPDALDLVSKADALVYGTLDGGAASVLPDLLPDGIATTDVHLGATLVGLGIKTEIAFLKEPLEALDATLQTGAAQILLRAADTDGIPALTRDEDDGDGAAEQSGDGAQADETPGEDDSAPLSLELTLPVNTGASELSGVALSAELTAFTLCFDGGFRPGGYPRFAVDGQMGLGDTRIAVEAMFDYWDETVTGRLTEPLSVKSLLKGVTGGEAPTGFLAEIGKIQVDEAWIVARFADEDGDTGILGAGFAVEAKDIALFGRLVTFSPFVRLWFENPLSGEHRTLYGTVRGEVKIGKAITVEGHISFPESRFHVAAQVQLDKLGEALKLPADPLLSKLLNYNVDFELIGDPDVGSYFVRARLLKEKASVELESERESESWSLRSIALSLEVGPEARRVVSIDAQLTIASASFTLRGVHAATEEGEDGAGWQLSAENEEEIKFSEVAEALFGDVALPDALKTLVLDDVALSIDTHSGSYAVTARTAQPLTIYKGLSAEIDILTFEKDGTDGNTSAELGGVISLEEHLRLRLAGKTTGKPGQWSFEGGTLPGVETIFADVVDAIAKALGQMADPPEMLKDQVVDRLSISFEMPGNKLEFHCDLSLLIDDTPVKTKVRILSSTETEGAEQENKRTLEFDADILLREFMVSGKFQSIANETRLVASVDKTTVKGGDETGTDPTLIHLDRVVGSLVPQVAGSLPEVEMALDQSVFVYGPKGTLFELDLELEASLNLADLPGIDALVGTASIGFESVGAIFSTAAFDADAIKELEKLTDPIRIKAAGKAGLEEGLAISVGAKLGSHSVPLRMPMTGGSPAKDTKDGKKTPGKGSEESAGQNKADGSPQTAPKEPEQLPVASPSSGAMRKWVSVDKSIGPLHVARVGAEYRDRMVGLTLDAGVDLAGLHVGLSGFALDFTIEKPPKPRFGLDGLDMSYAGGPVEITGAFLRIEEEGKPDRYDGLALVKTSALSISALGSYTTINGSASLFVFAALHAELGGPPFFRVQGLAGGFGYNRSLTLPPIEEVHEFPLVRAALDASFINMDKPGDGVSSALAKLGKYISPTEGQYWIAAGIKFSTFEVVQSVALLSVSFGEDVEIGLLGLSRLSLPQKGTGTEVAHAELALRAAIRPATGEIIIEGRLTNASWIFTRSCRLTGGFAFCMWVSGEHEGDFVVTLGGYGPRFRRPAHYPSVPRIGVDWTVSSQLRLQAELYFALTPSCIMAGGKLVATFETTGIRAWFVAYAHFEATWQPLTYHADMGIRIGVEANLELFTVNIEAGAILRVWGPPFQYRAEIDLWAISFTIGSDRPAEQETTVAPEAFVEAFLPDAAAVVAARITDGLIERHEATSKGPQQQIVNAHALRFEIVSQVPLTGFETSLPRDNTGPIIPEAKHGILPTGQKTLDAGIKIELTRNSVTIPSSGAPAIVPSVFPGRVPSALWSRGEDGEEPLVEASRGVSIRFAVPEPVGPLLPMQVDILTEDRIDRPDLPARLDAPTPPEETASMGDVQGETVSRYRKKVLAELQAAGFDMLGTVDLARMGVALDGRDATRNRYFQAQPQVCALGALCEREVTA